MARAYAERLANEQAAKSKPKEAAAAMPPPEEGGAAPQRTIFDTLLESLWEETTTFPGTNPATNQPIAPVTREVRSLVLPLKLPEPAEADKADKGVAPRATEAAAAPAEAAAEAEAAEAAEAGMSFVEALSHCVCKETTTRAWCAEVAKYRHAKVCKRLIGAPNALWLHTSSLPANTMETWEATHGGQPWLPTTMHLQLPTRPEAAVAEAPAAAGSAAAASATASAQEANPTVSLATPEAVVGRSVSRYTLRALVAFSQSVLPHASAGSGHLILFFRASTKPKSDAATTAALAHKVAMDALATALKMLGDPAAAAAAAAAATAPAAAPPPASEMVPCETPREIAEAFDGDGRWYAWNDFALRPVTEAEVRFRAVPNGAAS